MLGELSKRRWAADNAEPLFLAVRNFLRPQRDASNTAAEGDPQTLAGVLLVTRGRSGDRIQLMPPAAPAQTPLRSGAELSINALGKNTGMI
jgi:hypothetical protein